VLALAAASSFRCCSKRAQKLGEDVAIQIPPIDDSKFVSRLNDDRTKDANPPKSLLSPGLPMPQETGRRRSAIRSACETTPLRKRRQHPLHPSRYRP
jgi:hypothetical protein